MNKLFRLSVSFILAGVFLVLLLYALRSSSQALADPGPSLRSETEQNYTPIAGKPQANLIVTTLDDELNSDGDCSLREAIEAANTNTSVDACGSGDVLTDTITFDVAGTITVTSPLSVTAGGPLVIDGVNGITTNGGTTTRIWWVDSGAYFIMQNITIEKGFNGLGGGIYNDGNLLLVNDSIHDNVAFAGCGEWGCFGLGGGIYNHGNLVVKESTFSDNRANGSMIEGMYSAFNNTPGLDSANSPKPILAGGAGIFTDQNSFLEITNCAFSGNIGGFGSGIFNNHGYATIINSTFNGNEGSITIGNDGLTNITNSTISNNGSDDTAVGIFNHDTIFISSSTIYSNNAPLGGFGIWNEDGTAIFTNTILANNLSGGDCYVNAPIIDGGHNISSDDTCGFDPANDSMPNTDPLLGPLQDNGGPTWTHALLPDSPAIDAGDDAQCPPTDQRGVPRPIDGDGDGTAVCDIGSYEFQYGIYLFPHSQSGSGVPGANVEYSVQLYNWTQLIDTYSLALGSHAWDTELSASQVGPLYPGETTTFTVNVLIPAGTDWYDTDSVMITATSQTSPTVFTAFSQITTQAYAPPQITIEPLSLTSVQFTNQIVTKSLTISNGNAVTLTFEILVNQFVISDTVLFMHLDEPADSITFHDNSMYGNDGGCVEPTCPSSGLEGKFGNAVFFDGVDDFIQVPDDPSLNPHNAMAISAWIFPEDWNGNRRIVQKGSYDSQYRFFAEGGLFHLDIATIGRVSTDLPTPGSWHHVVANYDGNQMQLWIDGELKAQQPANGIIPTTSDPLYIGVKFPGSPLIDYFYGKIDELLVFNQALSEEEILILYSGSYPTPWLSVTPVSGMVPTNSSVPIQVIFDATNLQPDIYTTTLYIASNDPDSPVIGVPVTLTVIPQEVSPTAVTITGTESGLTGSLYTFTATVTPISTTLPLTYVWQASYHPPITHTTGLSDTAGWAWELPGTYAITVTASNPAGSVMDTHMITITVPSNEIYLPIITRAGAPPRGGMPYSAPTSGLLVGIGIMLAMRGRKEST